MDLLLRDVQLPVIASQVGKLLADQLHGLRLVLLNHSLARSPSNGREASNRLCITLPALHASEPSPLSGIGRRTSSSRLRCVHEPSAGFRCYTVEGRPYRTRMMNHTTNCSFLLRLGPSTTIHALKIFSSIRLYHQSSMVTDSTIQDTSITL